MDGDCILPRGLILHCPTMFATAAPQTHAREAACRLRWFQARQQRLDRTLNNEALWSRTLPNCMIPAAKTFSRLPL
jgi:hypothetical protein